MGGVNVNNAKNTVTGLNKDDIEVRPFLDDPTKVTKTKTSNSVGATLTRLLDMAKPERHLMVLSAITLAFSSVVQLAVPYVAGKIIDLSIRDDDDETSEKQSPFLLLVGMFGIMTFSGFLGFLKSLWQAKAGHRMVARLRRKLYAAVLSQDAGYFDATPQGDLISRLSSDADLVQSAVTDQSLTLLKNVVVAVGAASLLLYTSVSLALVSLTILPPIGFCARMVGRRMRDRQRRVRELHASATSLAEQALTCIRTVQQFVAEGYEAYQYNKAINNAHAEGIENTKLQAMFGSVLQVVINVAMLCVLGYGGMLVSSGKLTPGDLAGFVMYSVMMGGNVSAISSQYIDLMKAIAAGNRVFEIIDRVPAIPPPTLKVANDVDDLVSTTSGVYSTDDDIEMMELGNAKKPTADQQQQQPGSGTTALSVEFQNVKFAYPTRPSSFVLKGLTLSVRAGQMLALVGGSGAGKSTVASLLTRLYDNKQGGIIRIGGTDISLMDPQEVRRNVGIVVQEPLLFPTTIFDNIRYGRLNATDEEVREAARLAHVLDFTDRFPEGLQTVVGPRGTQLSGGQKQRVAVARCILKNPPIVIFDEATSALDAESEHHVQKAIDTACQGRTVILIAHRLSTIRTADQIAVLKDGVVAETGTMDELVSRPNGSFRYLMERQLVQ